MKDLQGKRSERERERNREIEGERGRQLALFFALLCRQCQRHLLFIANMSRFFTLYTCSPWAPLVIGHGVGGDEGVCKGEGKGCAPVNPNKAGSAHRATEWNENNERINNDNNKNNKKKTLC